MSKISETAFEWALVVSVSALTLGIGISSVAGCDRPICYAPAVVTVANVFRYAEGTLPEEDFERKYKIDETAPIMQPDSRLAACERGSVNHSREVGAMLVAKLRREKLTYNDPGELAAALGEVPNCVTNLERRWLVEGGGVVRSIAGGESVRVIWPDE